MPYDILKTEQFIKSLKSFIEQWGVQLNPPEYDDPAEFRQKDDGGIWVKIDSELTDRLRAM